MRIARSCLPHGLSNTVAHNLSARLVEGVGPPSTRPPTRSECRRRRTALGLKEGRSCPCLDGGRRIGGWRGRCGGGRHHPQECSLLEMGKKKDRLVGGVRPSPCSCGAGVDRGRPPTAGRYPPPCSGGHREGLGDETPLKSTRCPELFPFRNTPSTPARMNACRRMHPFLRFVRLSWEGGSGWLRVTLAWRGALGCLRV